MSDLFNSSRADFSPCRTWRYRLERRWGDGLLVAFIMLNPSTADEADDDPTIRRCIDYARRWGFGGLVVGNLFAYRSTNPAGLYTAADPVGPLNDYWLAQIARYSDRLICAWGAHGAYRDRGMEVLRMLRHRNPEALTKTKHGHPGHPLYLRADAKPFLLLPLASLS